MRYLTRRTLGLVGIAYCAGALTAQWTSTRTAEEAIPIVPAQAPQPAIGVAAEPEDTVVRPAPAPPHHEPQATATIGEGEAVDDLRARSLLVPVEGVEREQLRRSFDESRNGRSHEAIDILAPRGTPVRAADDGRIARLFTSDRGGITIYQFDPSERYCYYYAHLDRYVEGLREGQIVQRGQLLGYVGTTGNAPPDTPHLHFAIFALGPQQRWWEGTPIDPYPALR